MNERYLFRGKCDIGWVVGFLIPVQQELHIVTPDDENTAFKIAPATIGQCTGLRDKKGVLIFEGDILRDVDGDKIRVFYNVSHCAYMTEHVIPPIKTGWLGNQCSLFIEVIGNIHDISELLEVPQ